MSGPGGSSVPPPPPGNAGTAAWYAVQRQRERQGELERKMERLETVVLRELGEVKGAIRDLKLRARRSGHDVEELKEWQETSAIRDLREELAEAQRKLAERERVRRDGKWDGRMWALVSAVILTLATAIAAALTGGHAPHVETPPPAAHGSAP